MTKKMFPNKDNDYWKLEEHEFRKHFNDLIVNYKPEEIAKMTGWKLKTVLKKISTITKDLTDKINGVE